MSEEAGHTGGEGRPEGATEAERWLELKGINVFFAVVIGLAAIGFFVGTSSDSYDAQLAGFADEDRPEKEVEPARAYRELMEFPYYANRHWRQELDRIAADRPARTDEVERTPELFAAALEDRREHRAYEGAPPTIPHAINEKGASECMACHGEGLRIDGRLATPMSHEYLTNCTQCHVPEVGSIPAADERYDELPLDNTFVGLERWGPAERAHEGAPPVNPHPEHMREDCMSCHGEIARPGLRTTHPWKSECTQCHAPSATLDQHPMIPELPNMWEE